MDKIFKYWLPNEQGTRQDCETEHNSIVIIGANGSGKSKLGAWIERQGFDQVHRIAAQRKLNFQEDIQLINYSAAENQVFYGSTDPKQSRNKTARWGYYETEYTTKLIDDFGPVLAALLARQNMQQASYIQQCKEAEQNKQPKPNVPLMIIDSLQEIWSKVFPHRGLVVEDSKFFATMSNSEGIIRYPANRMSDGERSVLYLAAQVLCVPKDKILIIDEPELHLNRSIMHPLWITLEKCRPDCLFIYITHDTDFAALHSFSKKIWIREFDGNNWKLDEIKGMDLPEDLSLSLLGNRRNVLFVEGTIDSYDNKLYSLLYPTYYIVSCGSCEQVILRTKAFVKSSQLHHCKAYGIIDCDCRSDEELQSYQKDGVYAISVAEIENLFLAEDVLQYVGKHLAKNDIVSNIKKIILGRLSQRKDKQARIKAIATLKYQLSTADISGKSDQMIDNELQNTVKNLNYYQTKQGYLTKINKIIENNDYKEALKIFNDKTLIKEVERSLSMQDKSYIELVLRLLGQGEHGELKSIFMKYMPLDIPEH